MTLPSLNDEYCNDNNQDEPEYNYATQDTTDNRT